MKEVAQMLGVELGEEFKLKNAKTNELVVNTFKFTEEGLIRIIEDIYNFDDSFREIFNGEFEIVKLPKHFITDEEKEYLSNVIKPFKEKVTCISKTSYGNDKEYIFIEYYEKINRKYNIDFPEFKKGAMYKGMELDKEYTLEDLGL